MIIKEFVKIINFFFFELDNLLSKLKFQLNPNSKNENEIMISFQNYYHELIVLFKNEIEKSLCTTNVKSKDSNFYLEEYLLLHLDFMLYFRRKTQLCLYFKNRYTNLRIKSFKFNFYLHLLENKILQIDNEINLRRTDKYHLEKQYLDVFFYVKLLTQIQNLLVKNLENYQNLVKFKHVFNNKVLKGNNQDKSLNIKINGEDLLNSCLDMSRDYEDLLIILTDEFNESNLKNVELCFLLYNFFYLLDKHIPIEIESNFISIKDYFSLQHFETSFEEKGIRHPMIMKLTFKNFIITYISQKLCDNLGYKKQELLGEDFHKLLPTCFNEQHSLMIKKYMLYDKNCYFKKETFILAKNGYYFRLKVNLSALPGLSENTYMVDMQPAHHEILKPSNNFFVIVLDRKFNILTINEEFEEKFSLNLEMLKKMDVSIFDLFALPVNQIMSEFNEKLGKIENLNEHWNNLIEIFKCSDLKLLLKEAENKNSSNKQKIPELPSSPYKKNQSRELSNTNSDYSFNRNKFGDNYLSSKTFYRRKMVMTPFLQKLQSIVLENEYPKEWYNKITEIEKAINRSISPTIRLTFIKGLTSEFKNAPNDLLKIEIQLRCIANLPYYLIRIWDNEKGGRDSPFFKNKTINRNIFKRILLKKKLKLETESKDNILEAENESYQESEENEISEVSDTTVRKNKFEDLDQSLEANVELNEAHAKNLPITDRSKMSHVTQDKKISLIKKISNKILNLIPIVRYSGKLKIASINKISGHFQNLNETKDDSKMNFVSMPSSILKISNANNNNCSGILGIYSMNGSSDSASIHNFNGQNGSSPQKRYKRRMEIQKRPKKFKKSIINFLFLLVSLIVLITLSIYNVYFSSSRLSSSHKLFQINYNAMGLKGIIVFCGAGVISNCMIAGGLDASSIDGYLITLEGYQKKMKMRSQEMYVYVYALKSYLQASGEIPGMHEIYEIMTKQDVYYLMGENWQSYSRNSTFVDELDYFHYYAANLQNSGLWGKCRINGQGVYSNKVGDSAYFGEKVTYYTINNMMTKFRNNLLNLTTTSSKLLDSFHTTSKDDLLIFNIVIVCVFIILGITIVISINNYRRKINSVLKKLFEIKKEDEIFEKKLLNFKSVLLCLDKSSCIEYEENRVKISKDALETKEKSHTSKGVEQKYDNNNSTYFLMNNSQNISQNISGILNTQKKSINKSAVKISEKDIERDRAEKDFQNLKDKENNLLNDNCKENFEDYFYISFVKTSLYIIFVFNLFYVILILVNIITNMNDYSTILFSNRVAISFLDRIPRLMDLILYYKISIIQKNPNFITKPQSEYSTSSEFYNLFNFQTNLKDDTIFSSLSESEFSFILYMLQLERSNLKSFYDEKYAHILPKTRTIENSFNSKDACLTLGENTLFYTPNRDSTISLDFRNWFSLMSNYTIECKSINKGMNLNGFGLALDNHISSLVTLYIDFYRSDKKTPMDFLKDPNFLRAQINAEGSIKRYHNAILTTLQSDIESLYSNTMKKEYIFSSLKVIFSFTFIVYFIFLVILKLQNYAYHFKIGINKFKKAIG
jgi:PAS domain S-box-containing protein